MKSLSAHVISLLRYIFLEGIENPPSVLDMSTALREGIPAYRQTNYL